MSSDAHSRSGTAGAPTPLALIVATALGLAILAGTGGYVAGHAGGPNRQAAILAGERAGLRAGESAGHRLGYAAGLSAGDAAGYRRAYPQAYSSARRGALGG